MLAKVFSRDYLEHRRQTAPELFQGRTKCIAAVIGASEIFDIVASTKVELAEVLVEGTAPFAVILAAQNTSKTVALSNPTRESQSRLN